MIRAVHTYGNQAPGQPNRVREAALSAASSLFYKHGVRAVGMDAIVETAGVPKTSIYRHFPTKDALIAAFLDAEDLEFWEQWDEVTANHIDAPRAALLSLATWVGGKVTGEGYRGCPQINVAAEFADPLHPAREVARRHKESVVRRLTDLCEKINPQSAEVCGHQIALLFDGAFTSGGRFEGGMAIAVLQNAVVRLISSPD